jgi:tricorn protease
MASTNFAMNSGLLDMSAYEHATTRGLYLMVLAKGEPSPLLPESDEEAARAGMAPTTPGGALTRAPASAGSGARAAGRADRGRARVTPAARAARARGRARCASTSTGCSSASRRAGRGAARLRSSCAPRPGTVFFVERAARSPRDPTGAAVARAARCTATS